MVKRIVTVAAVAAIFCSAGVSVSSAQSTSDAYHIDRQGRRLADRAKSPEDLKKAEEKYQQALRIFRKLKHRKGEAEVLNDLGIFYSERRQYSRAEDYFGKALTIKREVGELEGVGSVEGDEKTKRVTIRWDTPATWEMISGTLKKHISI